MTTAVSSAIDRAPLAIELLDRLEEVTIEYEGQLARAAGLRRGQTADAANTADSSVNATDIENEELVARSLQQRRDQLIEALTRLRDGTYGTCATCRQPILAERLLASPSATLCVRCQTAAERHPR
ncbi:TraR/DksA family transcriptional regulator [Catellatospora paridis]|uniref:TraR/DksA family transcriptional regulator n=1 Tax=Catellatospora paridis TaxID=1617086 RepID=UPI0012D3EE5B|nr:TraR/DksA C4-type zinc finger protein [Catellatospora paridis]